MIYMTIQVYYLHRLIKRASCSHQAMKVVGIKAHTENDKGQVLLDLYIRWVICLLSFFVFILSVHLFSLSVMFFFLLLQLRWKRWDWCRGQKVLLQSWSEWNTGVCLPSFLEWIKLLSGMRLLLLCHTFWVFHVSLHCSVYSFMAWCGWSWSRWLETCPSLERSPCFSSSGLCVCSHSPPLAFLLSFSVTAFAFLLTLGGIDFSTVNTFFLRMAYLLCFLPSQKLDINWTGLTNLLDIPGLKWVSTIKVYSWLCFTAQPVGDETQDTIDVFTRCFLPSQRHVWQHDHGCHRLLPGVAQPPGHPPGPRAAFGSAAISVAQGMAPILQHSWERKAGIQNQNKEGRKKRKKSNTRV